MATDASTPAETGQGTGLTPSKPSERRPEEFSLRARNIKADRDKQGLILGEVGQSHSYPKYTEGVAMSAKRPFAAPAEPLPLGTFAGIVHDRQQAQVESQPASKTESEPEPTPATETPSAVGEQPAPEAPEASAPASTAAPELFARTGGETPKGQEALTSYYIGTAGAVVNERPIEQVTLIPDTQPAPAVAPAPNGLTPDRFAEATRNATNATLQLKRQQNPIKNLVQRIRLFRSNGHH